MEGQQKAPDYTFRVGQLPKFYAEAKKCGVNISADPAPAYQLRRYGWSAKLALSILTDFEELGVYDCTAPPRPSDKASHARIQYFRFDEYPDRWRELWDVFSREAVWSGAFDKYAASKRKRGTSEVDVAFLKEIEGWRDALARNIALRNKNLSSDDLNTAVQLTIDRVVFLRMAEDRALEPDEQLLKLCERPDIYPRFMRDLCRRADQKYNSGLFHFQKESGVSEDPDRITPGLAVDDKVFKPILQSLYFAHGSPYHFGVLPVEILGTVYERFLGKVIRLTAGHQAKVEEKPEVRKAGGVYYTPAYIVAYIVKHTVSRQIEGRSPAQLAGGPAGSKGKPPFRILDMACGSGSFLLGAYQCLLDHSLKWYTGHKPETHKKAVYKDPRNGHWRLTIEEKKRILTTHLFGVDIDLQAVEVSKLSLLLKVLEGETDQSLSLSQLPFGDRALPNLADNIKCGNSLIGPDYFTGKLIADPEEMKRVNPFDWQRDFPQVFLPSPSGRGQGEGAGGEDGHPKPPLPPDLLAFARDLRRKQTDAESLIWSLLRNRRLGGFKFRRQHSIPPYIVDFYCHDANLAIELDGGQHNEPSERSRDERRAAFLQQHGIRVLRFWNHHVLRDTHVVLEAIWNALPGKTLTPTLSQREREPVAGGFDCIIGNPPYIRIQTMKEWAPLEVEIYKELFHAGRTGNYDIYVVFIEQGLKLLNPKGQLGFICPHKFFNAKYGAALRSLVADGQHLGHVVHFGDQQVFDRATTYTCLLFLDKPPTEECRFVKVNDLTAWRVSGAATEGPIKSKHVTALEWNFAVGPGAALFEKLSRMPVKLGEVAHIFVGTQSSAEQVFVLEECDSKGANIVGKSKALGKLVVVEAACAVPFLRGREIRRYLPPVTSSFLICPYRIRQESCDLIPEEQMRKVFPRAWAYLEANKQTLLDRERGRFRGPGWHAFGYPKSMHLFGKPKIIVPDYNNVASFTYDQEGHFYKTGYGVLPREKGPDCQYLLGLLNSKLLFWYLKRIGTFLRGSYIRFWTQFTEQLPIRSIDRTEDSEKSAHERMVSLVEAMLALHQQLAVAKSAAQKGVIQRQIEATDAEVDRLVYELYGLTAEEIALVEGASA
ncbi:MAG: DUF559 domain-containing protein [Candidatus Acidoferrales bacterium]